MHTHSMDSSTDYSTCHVLWRKMIAIHVRERIYGRSGNQTTTVARNNIFIKMAEAFLYWEINQSFTPLGCYNETPPSGYFINNRNF